MSLQTTSNPDFGTGIELASTSSGDWRASHLKVAKTEKSIKWTSETVQILIVEHDEAI